MANAVTICVYCVRRVNSACRTSVGRAVHRTGGCGGAEERISLAGERSRAPSLNEGCVVSTASRVPHRASVARQCPPHQRAVDPRHSRAVNGGGQLASRLSHTPIDGGGRPAGHQRAVDGGGQSASIRSTHTPVDGCGGWPAAAPTRLTIAADSRPAAETTGNGPSIAAAGLPVPASAASIRF